MTRITDVANKTIARVYKCDPKIILIFTDDTYFALEARNDYDGYIELHTDHKIYDGTLVEAGIKDRAEWEREQAELERIKQDRDRERAQKTIEELKRKYNL